MPGKSLFTDALFAGATPDGGSARAPAAMGGQKVLHTVDATLRAGPGGPPAPGIGELTTVATAAVRAGHGHVLDTSHVIFPNGAVTLVLILAESHLAIHTWPEEDRIAIDLFSCGTIDAERVMAQLVRGLGLTGVRAQRIEREAGPVQAGPVQAGPGQAGPGQAGAVRAGAVQAGPVQAGPVQAGTESDSPN
jgi:S-adenosylmethionine/arginine decarboxylase-like enzyme